MNRNKAIKFLKENPVFWSRLGFSYDPPLKNEQGKPLVFTEDLDKFARFHRDFAKAGVKIQTCILHAGWMGVDEFDYSLTDRVLEAVFQDNPDSYFIPRIKLNVPVEWCRKYPDEVFVYYEGPRDAEDIRALVGTDKHDWLGYEAPNGYYKAGDYVDKRPNVGGLIARQSFSSQVWLRDAGIALERLVDRLENSAYGPRILGYHIAFGVSGESVLWGRQNNHYGDYGIANTKHFLNWGLKKYGSMEALRKVWGAERFCEDSLILPSPDERYHRCENITEFFRADALGTISADLDTFTSESCANAIEYFGKILRRKVPEKLIGTFYGYFILTDNPNYAGHLALEQLLNSDYIDFFAAPKSYYRTGPGEPGGFLSCAQSINLKKIWLDETDVRTHLTYADNSEDNAEWLCHDFKDTRAVLWREFCKNLSTDSGFWWMDLGGGWYDDPAILDEISHMRQINEELCRQPHESAADVLVLVDETCIEKMNISHKQRQGFMEDPLMELHRCGVVSDCYRLRDLPQLKLDKYKMIVFAYTFDLSDAQREFLSKNIRSDTVLVFHHAAGIRKGQSVSLDHVREFTGFSMVERSVEGGYVGVQVNDPSANVFFMDPEGMPAVWQKENRFAVTDPYLDASVYRRMAEHAGCHLWTSCGNILWTDDRIAGVFTKDRLTGEICFPKPSTYREVISGNVFRDISRIDLEALQTNAAVFLTE